MTEPAQSSDAQVVELRRNSLNRWDAMRKRLGRAPLPHEWRDDLVGEVNLRALKHLREAKPPAAVHSSLNWGQVAGLCTLLATFGMGVGAYSLQSTSPRDLQQNSTALQDEEHSSDPLPLAAKVITKDVEPTPPAPIVTAALEPSVRSDASPLITKECIINVGDESRTLLSIYEEMNSCAPLSKTDFLHSLFDLGFIRYRNWDELGDDIASRLKEVYGTHPVLHAMLQHKLSTGECIHIPSSLYADMDQEDYPDQTYCIEEGTLRERYGYTRIRHLLFGAKGHPQGFCPTPEGVPSDGCTLESFIDENQELFLRTLVANTKVKN